VTIHLLTPDRWDDLVAVFEEGGDARSCWCMWFRQTSEEYRQGSGHGNREAFEAIVKRGDVPGLLAYVGGEPAAWCAVQPREELKRLDRSRISRSLDGAPAWAVVCFVTRKGFRGQGLTEKLLEAAVRYAAAKGATLVEGFPVDSPGKVSASTGFHGFANTFRACGFEEVAHPSRTRTYMRRAIG
jgi:GNAT superfamily N-acetyltransferase